MKHILFLLTAFVALMGAAQGGGRIFIENFDIAPDSTVTVQVMLDNPEPTLGLQFKMTMPEGLTVDELELTKYSKKLKMNLADRLNGDTWIIAVYSMALDQYPPNTAAVLTMTVTASPEFEGGDIAIYRSQGSTEDFVTIKYDDTHTAVLRRP